VFSTLQGLLAATGLGLWFLSLGEQQDVALHEAERVVGISGVVTPADLMVTPHPVAYGLVIGVFISLLVSAAAGLIAPVRSGTRSTRYERAQPETPSELWDQLSHGDDPTAR
jgi:indole-3-glycerol phosphate synthase